MKSDKSDEKGVNTEQKRAYEAPVGVVCNNKEKDERESTRKAKERYLAILEKLSGASIKLLTTHAQISRDTYYRWLREDKDFKGSVEEITQTWDDVVKDKLLERIMKDDLPAIKFYLSHRHPEFMRRRAEKIEPNSGERSFEDLLDDYGAGKEAPEFADLAKQIIV